LLKAAASLALVQNPEVPRFLNSPFVIEILLVRIHHFTTKSIMARSDQFRAQSKARSNVETFESRGIIRAYFTSRHTVFSEWSICNRNIASQNSACSNQVTHGAIRPIPSSKERREAMSKPLSATVLFAHISCRGVPCALNCSCVIEILRFGFQHINHRSSTARSDQFRAQK